MPTDYLAEEAALNAKHRLLDAIRKHALFAARFECSGQNFDRPIGVDEFGREKFDPRWYAVMSAKDHFVEGIAGAIEDELKAYAAVIAYRAVRATAAEGD